MPRYTKAGAACTSLAVHLNRSSTCTQAGITDSGATPLLVLCRHLLAAGLDPDSAQEIYRISTLALRASG
jgi:hypothetical protein